MVKLVFIHSWGDEVCSGRTIIPFEYSSKDDAILYILDKPVNHWGRIEVFDIEVDIDYVEHNIYTLEKWYEINKEKLL